DPVRELPYWPAAMALLIEAGQMTASDYVPKYPDLTLASKGASTDVILETTPSSTSKPGMLHPKCGRNR
ncbi:hypothetical protein, partial [Blastomonas sp.]|uniref:hypothetical protein n=1 Tax=Blastomonas sp. TaxID=1909299 RepID=UPI0035943FC6